MFGMLDYRAHKLYIILFGIPIFLLSLFSLFGLPFIYYAVGSYFADTYVMKIIMSLICLIFIELIWLVVVMFISKVFQFIFGLIVDVIPADGRTNEEAKLVVWSGDKAIFLLKFNQKKPKDWSDNDKEKLAGGFFNYFFKENIIERIDRVREHYIDNPDINPDEFNTKAFLKENNLEIGIFERIVTDFFFSACVIRYSIFLYLILFSPF